MEILSKRILSSLSLAIILGFVSIGSAQDKNATTTEPPAPQDVKLKPGVVASYGNFPKRTAINVSGDAAPGDEQSPVSASITRNGPESCVATLKNSSKGDSYSVNFEVVGTTASGSNALKKSFSASIGPEKSITRNVTCRKDLNMAVVLKSGKKL